MNQTVYYEAAVLATIAVGVGAYKWASKREKLVLSAQVQVVQILAVFVLLAVLAVIATVSVLALKSSSVVKACEHNELAISTALTAYDEAVGQPIADQSQTALTQAKITTLFANPSDTNVVYLSSPIIDPADPTGTYSLTYTSSSSAASASYTILCPGGHSKADLNALNGTFSTGQIQYQNGSFSKT